MYYEDEFCSNDKSQLCCDNTLSFDSFDFERYETFKQFDMNNCGRMGGGNRIANGQDAFLLEFPWIGLLGNEREVDFVCGATLISEHYALSAAHCFLHDTDMTRNEINILRLGEHQKSEKFDCIEYENTKTCADPVQDIKINYDDVIIHAEYDPIKSWHDIALIRLSEAAKIGQNNIKPICLPFNQNSDQIPKILTVSGFGRTESSVYNSDVLLKVNVNRVENDRCEAAIINLKGAQQKRISDNQFCAGSSKDSCPGDSGSPIFFPGIVKNVNVPRCILYGLVSYGSSKCGSITPGVYTKMYPYLPWVLSNMK